MSFVRLFSLMMMVAAVSSIAAACGPSRHDAQKRASTPQLSVSAAASLTDVLPKIDKGATYQFAGSNELATQLREGAPVDVFASANTQIADELYRDGVVDRPVVFASNRVVLITAPHSSITSFARLIADRDAIIAIAGAGVPLGDYTRDVLADLHASALVRRAAGGEHDARAVLAKVALGEADAGFVYVTDAAAFGPGGSSSHPRVIELPASAANHALYSVAVVRDAPHRTRARAFAARLMSPAGQRALRDAGFGPP